MADERYLEDFSVGQKFQSGSITVNAAEIKAFASQFDPQPFHLDEQAAATTFFGGLVASGWHTAALTMRLIVDSELKIAGGSIGAGAEELRWPRPVRPATHSTPCLKCSTSGRRSHVPTRESSRCAPRPSTRKASRS